MEAIFKDDLCEIYMYTDIVGDSKSKVNTYFICNLLNKHIILVDPGVRAENLLNLIKTMGCDELSIIVTHAHADHIFSINKLLKAFPNAKIYIHEKDVEALNNYNLNESEKVGVIVDNISKKNVCELEVSNKFQICQGISIETIHTAGHTIGSVCFYLEKQGVLFTGDTLFANSYGRTDLATGNMNMMRQSINSLFERFSDVEILPGHGVTANIQKCKHKVLLLLNMQHNNKE